MSAIAGRILCLFLPAGAGLGVKLLTVSSWAERCLTLALLLLCLEQTHMAIADLQQIAEVKNQGLKSPRLHRFQQVTLSTLALELLGFYVAWIWLGGGALLVLLSLLGFNLLAGVQLQPHQPVLIEKCGPEQRWPVIVADLVGLVLASLWHLQIAPLATALGLLGMICLYGMVKYGERFFRPNQR